MITADMILDDLINQIKEKYQVDGISNHTGRKVSMIPSIASEIIVLAELLKHKYGVDDVDLFKTRYYNLNRFEEIFAKNLSSILRSKHMTQRELSRRTGISEGVISKYVKGERKIGYVETLVRIANGLGCTIEVLLQEDLAEQEEKKEETT